MPPLRVRSQIYAHPIHVDDNSVYHGRRHQLILGSPPTHHPPAHALTAASLKYNDDYAVGLGSADASGAGALMFACHRRGGAGGRCGRACDDRKAMARVRPIVAGRLEQRYQVEHSHTHTRGRARITTSTRHLPTSQPPGHYPCAAAAAC